MDDKKQQRILIADDDIEIRKIFGSALAASGFFISYARNGYECFDAAKRFNPDLIILDVMMPELDGIATLKKIKAEPDCASIPVIFLTSLEDTPATVKAAKELGAVEVINKTIDLDEFLAKIINLLTSLQHE